MIHDLSVLIMWVTSLGVTAWGQHWRAKAKRLEDAVMFMLEEESEELPEEDEAGTQDPGDRV